MRRGKCPTCDSPWNFKLLLQSSFEKKSFLLLISDSLIWTFLKQSEIKEKHLLYSWGTWHCPIWYFQPAWAKHGWPGMDSFPCSAAQQCLFYKCSNGKLLSLRTCKSRDMWLKLYLLLWVASAYSLSRDVPAGCSSDGGNFASSAHWSTHTPLSRLLPQHSQPLQSKAI